MYIYILPDFLRQTNAFFKTMVCCIHRGCSAVFTKVFTHVEGPLESNVALSKTFFSELLYFLKTCCINWWYTLLK